MNKVASQLKKLREAAGLSIEQLADQIGAEASSLRDAEAGARTPPVSVLGRCALLAGLEPDEFVRGADVHAPPIALLRMAADASADALQLLRSDKAPLLCGELVHRARLVDLVERRSASERSHLPVVARAPETPHEHPSEEEARRARLALGVGDAPIPSMRALLERHGVLIIWTEDEVPDTIDGVSLLKPIPTVLVNLRHGRERHTHTRMTLAHELAHLLFDHLRRGVAVIHSPSVLRALSPLEGFEDIERGANAFAACFLAPAHLVRQRVGELAPDSEDAVIAVAGHFGVGRTVAINRIHDVFGLSDETRETMLRRPPRRFTSVGRDDVPREAEIGLRRGVFRQRVVEALSQRLISRERAWSLLALSPTEPLDEAPTEALRAPLISREQMILSVAARAFDVEGFPDHAFWWRPVTATELGAGRWQVRFIPCAGAPGDQEALVTLSETGRVLDDELRDEFKSQLGIKAILEGTL